MIVKENNFKKETLLNIAKQMCVAARTAPKARGIDNLEIAIVEGDTIKKLSDDFGIN